MPGIAMDGSEDLPNDTTHNTFCPTCYWPGIRMAKNFERRTYCQNNHSWPHAMGLLAQPEDNLSNQTKPVDSKQNSPYDLSQLIKRIEQTVKDSAENARMNAGLSGSWGDGGACQMEDTLAHWLDGVKFAQTGKTDTYRSIIIDINRETDPEYQKWLELNKKFGK